MLRMVAVLMSVVAFLTAGCEVPQTVRSAGQGIRNFGRRVKPSDSNKEGLGSPLDGKKVYYVVEIGGQRRSRGYRIRKRSTYRGKPCVITEREQTNEMVREGVRFTEVLRAKTITAIDGAALYSSEVVQSNGERRTRVVTVEGGKAEFKIQGPGGSDTYTVKVPAGVMFGLEPSWILSKGAKPGRKYAAKVLDRGSRELVSETVRLEKPRALNVLGQEMQVHVAQTVRDEGAPMWMMFTEEGDLVRLEAEDMLVRLVEREETRQPVEALKIVSNVPTDFALPAWDHYSRMRYVLTPAAEWKAHVQSSPYSQVQEVGDAGVVVDLFKNAPRIPRGLTLPLTVPEEMQPYMVRSETILPHMREIQELSRSIIADEKDALRAVALLAGWVHHAIRFSGRGGLNPSPLSTLESRRGDCSEHADLFASLARAQGIPTRRCHGLIIQQESAVYHTWVEVWLSGIWVPVDTTVNRVGLPAGYLLTAYGTGDGVPNDTFAWTMRKGTLKMGLREVERKNVLYVGGERMEKSYVLVPNKKPTYVVVDENWLANLYWGFSLTKRDNWDGRVTLNTVELTSPDRKGAFKCEAIDAVYATTERDLDRVVGALKKNMTNYRPIETKISTFGKRGTVEALLTDFTCEQDGTTLRCRQYIVPKRGRSYRISLWAPVDAFPQLMADFSAILETVSL